MSAAHFGPLLWQVVPVAVLPPTSCLVELYQTGDRKKRTECGVLCVKPNSAATAPTVGNVSPQAGCRAA